MKGISDVIAMLLMLVITIGLVGLAYSYISGVFTARTAVVLEIEPGSTFCINTTHAQVGVRNAGTSTSGTVTLQIFNAAGQSTTATLAGGGLASGELRNQIMPRPSGAGYLRVVASTTGSSASGTIYCSV
jgi:FlaG/FlaF family flagellin (archaellin)